mmetsp:Transcript_1392/g.1930  ORF Transcript_1392/g.1930 Transcript_1392/m.1930 type:complete len:141 (-) Transcript_1392:276-698(-)|eukprot:CAMPEP_0194046932 /NCGR_PEP_ID=MMETSP0009_2-20130614/23008_1 /TAXON_ID=210454 /ORGANISM="Grammatophora oceanica, Strain CCMP 410" /LENGTH=140 /DNA_ID=CAMNT_0038692403 /DNA_START=152 /DNA_END=574 /DNA_ORIENTATION=+
MKLLFTLLPVVVTTAFTAIPPAKMQRTRPAAETQLYLDQNIIMGAAVGVGAFAAGIGLVAFTEIQGERAKERGSGISDGMATRIAGQLLEDVEVDSVADLGSLTQQLESALKESGGAKEDELTMSEEDKKRIQEEADDGW